MEPLVLADVLPGGDGDRELQPVGPLAFRLPGLPSAQRRHRSRYGRPASAPSAASTKVDTVTFNAAVHGYLAALPQAVWMHCRRRPGASGSSGAAALARKPAPAQP
jgi:uncharacterized membrane protein